MLSSGMYSGRSRITTTLGKIGQCIIDSGDGINSLSVTVTGAGAGTGAGAKVVAGVVNLGWFLERCFFFKGAVARVGEVILGILEAVGLVVGVAV